MSNLLMFKIDRKTPILIYGAAGNGLRGYHSLKIINGYNVVGFIDRRSDEIDEQYGLPVYGIEATLPHDKKDVLVIICIKNVFEHEHIASDLIKQGFRNLIFKPLEVFKSDTDIDFHLIDNHYEQIFNDKNPASLYKLAAIPELDKLDIYHFFDYANISETATQVLVNMPLADIYVDMKNVASMIKNTENLTSTCALVPHISLFKVLNGMPGETQSYIDYCISTISNSQNIYGQGGGKIEVTDSWINNLISNRAIVFENMALNSEIDTGFFTDHAPTCYFKKPYLVMKSAKHRAAFFIARGRQFMPVLLDKKDYDEMINEPVLQQVIKHIKSLNNKKLDAPILHPYLYKYPSQMPNYHELFIKALIFQLGKILRPHDNIASITVENSIKDDGALSRILSKIGFNVRTRVEAKEDVYFLKLLDKLFFIESNQYSSEYRGANIICLDSSDVTRHDHIEAADYLVVIGEARLAPELEDFELLAVLFNTVWNGKPTAGYLLRNLNDQK